MTADPSQESLPVPASAASKVEFISLTHLNPSTELNPIPSLSLIHI